MKETGGNVDHFDPSFWDKPLSHDTSLIIRIIVFMVFSINRVLVKLIVRAIELSISKFQIVVGILETL
jgi:hypothetical protein